MQKAVGHVIKNQIAEPRDIWVDAKTYSDILIPSRFNAVGKDPYNEMLAYLDNRDGSNQAAEQVIWAYLTVFYGNEDDFTGGAHYFMGPGTYLESQLIENPERYQRLGPFDWCDNNEFRMYRCLY